MMGGKPRKALYFVGYEGDGLIFLDPHKVNDAVNPDEKDTFDVGSYTWTSPKKISFSNIDPCLGVGFLVKDSTEFSDLETELKSLKVKHGAYNIISIR